MSLDEIRPNDIVYYMPLHAHGDRNHPDVERGKVSSKNAKYVFVKFDRSVAKLGWEGTTSQSCKPEDLFQ